VSVGVQCRTFRDRIVPQSQGSWIQEWFFLALSAKRWPRVGSVVSGRLERKEWPGVGSAHARICFVGEGPGREEDISGIPFVGQAGQLLDRMLAAEGLKRSDCYITNIVKCRPPNNRVPEASEVASCSLYLYAELAVIEPEVICLLGNTALHFFFGDRYFNRSGARYPTDQGPTTLYADISSSCGITKSPVHPNYPG